MHLIDLGCVYLIFGFFGYWIYAFAFRHLPVRAEAPWLLIPIFGLGALAVYSANIIVLSLPFPGCMQFLLLTTFILNVIGLWIQRQSLINFAHHIKLACVSWPTAREALIGKARQSIPAAWLAGASMVVMGPLQGLSLTTPWRLGPDAISYVSMAAYLLRGGTLAGLSGQYTNPIEVYVYEFWVQGLRRSGGGVIAAASYVLDRHPAETAFLITGFCLLLCALAVFVLTRQLFDRKHWDLCGPVAAAVALNCNLLYVFYEGSYIQVMSMPIMVAVIVLARLNVLQGLPALASAAIYGFLISGMSGIYPEALIILPMLLGGYAVLDFIVLKKRFGKRDLIVVAGAAVIALALNWDVLSQWLAFQKQNNQMIGGAGWAQPRWASLTDIMGWINIYMDMLGNTPVPLYPLKHLSSHDMFAKFSIVVFFGLIVAALWRSRASAAIVATVPLTLIGAAYIQFFYRLNISSYSYMKIYTLVLPLLMAGVAGSLLAVTRRGPGRVIVAALSLLTILNGIWFVTTYRVDDAYFTPGMLELARAESEAKLDGYVLLPLPQTSKYWLLGECFMRTLIKGKMIAPNFFAEQDFSASRKLPVALIVRAADRPKTVWHDEDILWRGSEYLIVNTHIPVESAWKNQQDIHWQPWPLDIPRPELELRWMWLNDKLDMKNKLDFTPYYRRAD